MGRNPTRMGGSKEVIIALAIAVATNCLKRLKDPSTGAPTTYRYKQSPKAR